MAKAEFVKPMSKPDVILTMTNDEARVLCALLRGLSRGYENETIGRYSPDIRVLAEKVDDQGQESTYRIWNELDDLFGSTVGA